MNQQVPMISKSYLNVPDGVWIPIAVLIILSSIDLFFLLDMNNGTLVYTLDDPYIHFALAENIRNGHYGVNVIEFSAPSSTFLWPLILAPFTGLPVFDYVPQILNILAAAATLLIFHWVMTAVVNPGGHRKRHYVALTLTCLLIPTTNLVGLVFTGMEHSLQVLLAVMVVCGMIVESRTQRTTWWLIAAIVAGPLVRYENLALAVPALGYLCLRGHFRPVLLSAGLIVVALGAFSLSLTP